MRFYISADIEGIVGVVNRPETKTDGFDWQRARLWMTESVVVACKAAIEAGATELIVSDPHGSGMNILIDQLPHQVQLVRSWPRPLGMMQGIEVGKFDGAMLIGYHTGSTHLTGVLGHSFYGVLVREVKLNGKTVSEGGFSAEIAAHYGAPVIMISGDDAFCEETTGLIGKVETAVVKWAYGTLSARSMVPEAAYSLIRDKVRAAIHRLKEFKSKSLKAPITLEITMKHRLPVEHLAYMKFFERTDAYTIRYVGQDMEEISKALMFMLSYNSTAF
ncbi:MAG: M55 family metallopeptidase [Proteobacteria bacterium]|nr:M55 family metallopeptidase [Pseudomonadota bacterium]MBI3497149.1 M55 family metallopeptidase [Pseudomonadota bacterium]